MRTKPFNKLCYVEIKPMAWWVDVNGGGGTGTILLISLLSPIFFTLFYRAAAAAEAAAARQRFQRNFFRVFVLDRQIFAM